jgi:hypothetical protein
VPWELAFEEPRAFAARPSLSGERRRILKLAIGDSAVNRAVTLIDSAGAGPDSERVIRLRETGLLEDLKHDWLAVPVVRLYEAIEALAAMDLSDDRSVGRRLRPKTNEVIARADAVVELTRFIDMFGSILQDLVRPACVLGFTVASSLIKWMTAESDTDSSTEGRAFDMLITTEFRDRWRLLHALPASRHVMTPQLADGPTEFETLIGVPFPAGIPRWTDVQTSLENQGYDLCELGGRQLPYFGTYRATDTIWSRNFFDSALRITRSDYPLLAHRAAYLAWQLLESASKADSVATTAILRTFFEAESEWMIDSQQSYEKAVARYRDGDLAAIVEAYGDLTEGTLRRYASLVLALECISVQVPPQSPLVLEIIGDVETRLRTPSGRQLPELILRFLERDLRNADAHANVVLDAMGNLRVRNKDGTISVVVPNQVYGRTAGMRSLLDGIDVAMNHAFIRDLERDPRDWKVKSVGELSEHLFEAIVRHAAELHTRGSVSESKLRDGVLTIKFWGGADAEELNKVADAEELSKFVSSLTAVLGPDLPVIRVVDDDGSLITTFHPPELVQTPEDMRRIVGLVYYRTADGLEIAGTAFFVGMPWLGLDPLLGHIYIVTASHILTGISMRSVDGQIYVRVQMNDGRPAMIVSTLEEWTPHPDTSHIDAAVFHWVADKSPFEYRSLPAGLLATSEALVRNDVQPGDDLFIVGLFYRDNGQDRIRPIVSTGKISLLKGRVDTRTPYNSSEAYLIEAGSTGGLGGSPVFVPLESRPTASSESADGPFLLLGLLHIDWDDSQPSPSSFDGSPSVVVPAWRIRELLEHPDLKARRAEIEASFAASGERIIDAGFVRVDMDNPDATEIVIDGLPHRLSPNRDPE